MAFNATFNNHFSGGHFGGQWRKLEYPKKTTDLSQGSDKLYHIMFYGVHLASSGIQTLNFSDDGTDCTGSCKSNYHTITIMTAPCWYVLYKITSLLYCYIIGLTNLGDKFCSVLFLEGNIISVQECAEVYIILMVGGLFSFVMLKTLSS